MLSSRFVFTRIRLPSRPLHVAVATATVTAVGNPLPIPVPRSAGSHGHDPELLLLRLLSRRDVREARRLLDETPNRGISGVVRWTAALSRYARDGFVDEARVLFDLMPARNLVTWNAMLSAYIRSTRLPAATELFHRMPERNVVSWTAMLCGFARAGRFREAWELFNAMPDRNVVSWNAMISGLAGGGDIEGARRLFDEMPERSAASWNALIAGYAEKEQMVEARRLFDRMGGCEDVVSWTTMVAGYCRAGDVWEAYDLFRAMPVSTERNVVTWTAMIGGFAWNSYNEEALLLFKEMSVKPNVETIVSLIYACSGLGFPLLGKQVHCYAITNGMDDGGDSDNEKLSKALMYMYSRFGLMDWARYIFDRSGRTPDAVCWNSMIDGYVRVGDLDEARRLFDTIIAANRKGLVVTWTTIVSAYLDAGDVPEARKLFDEMPERDSAAWAALISGLVRNERVAEAFEAFSEMRVGGGIAPADHALAALLGAAGAAARGDVGEQVHGLMTKTRPEGSDTILCNALISMYAKGGDADSARRVFDEMEPQRRDVVSWNAVITGLAHHGRAHEALQLFEAMRGKSGAGLEPNGGRGWGR